MKIGLRSLLALAGVWLLGCQPTTYPAPMRGTAYRISADQADPDSEVFIDLYTSLADCQNDPETADELEDCLPYAQRRTAEVHLAFTTRDMTSRQRVPRSLEPGQVRLVQDGQLLSEDNFVLLPHDPVAGGQLFVLLIDGSGSMYDNEGERILKVYDALRQPDVLDSFFPEGEEPNGVVLLQFADRVIGMDGRDPRIIRSRKEYLRVIDENLLLIRRSSGTRLYSSLIYTLENVLQQQNIKDFARSRLSEPVVIMLTDGFNFESSSDACDSNVERLKQTIDRLREFRQGSFPPTVHTVGLGAKNPYLPTTPIDIATRVTASSLCGDAKNSLIDAPRGKTGLEDVGIDHRSLEWLANEGGGRMIVKRKADGLAQAFRDAAAVRYRWYQLRFKTGQSLHHRQRVNLELRLANAQHLTRSSTKVSLLPSAWLDGPPGDVPGGLSEAESWSTPAPSRRIAALYLMLGTLLIGGLNLGPAWFNIRRAWTRRARPRRSDG